MEQICGAWRDRWILLTCGAEGIVETSSLMSQGEDYTGGIRLESQNSHQRLPAHTQWAVARRPSQSLSDTGQSCMWEILKKTILKLAAFLLVFYLRSNYFIL